MPPKDINSRGAAVKQDKNWTRTLLAADKYYIHCSSTEPSTILKSAGLDPAFGKEEITIQGSKHATGKFILAYPANPNQITPNEFIVPKTIRLLWDFAEIKFAYCFKWSVGDPVFAQGGYQGLNPVETGFDQAISPTKIVKLYFRNNDTFQVLPAKVAKLL